VTDAKLRLTINCDALSLGLKASHFHNLHLPLDLVGSKTGAVLRRFGLAGAPRFLWECLNIRTVSRFPVSATSNPSCRFPAMGLPACFPSKFMRQVRLAAFSGVTRDDEAGNHDRVPAVRVATSYSTVSNRSHLVPGLASDVAEPSSLPSL
jgi:anti-sigma factor RsiW